jgi:hypothetical protein
MLFYSFAAVSFVTKILALIMLTMLNKSPENVSYLVAFRQLILISVIMVIAIGIGISKSMLELAIMIKYHNEDQSLKVGHLNTGRTIVYGVLGCILLTLSYFIYRLSPDVATDARAFGNQRPVIMSLYGVTALSVLVSYIIMRYQLRNVLDFS